uniref:Cyclin-L1 n=1 Tax=Lygus hesperus TaxID=30085 RepID=A0A146LUG2_LYGHE
MVGGLLSALIRILTGCDTVNDVHHVSLWHVDFITYVFLFGRPISPLILDQGYINQKNQVIKAERRILKELGFCVHVKHPHKIIVMYLQVLGCEKNKNLMQLSWNYMNDALRSDCFMRFDPETVACACIYLSARYLGICLPKNPPWFDLFRVNEENIIVVCQKILLLYNRPKVNADDLERRVDELKKSYQELKAKQRIIVSGNNTPNSTNSPVRNNHSDKGRSRSDSRSRSASKTPTKHKRSKTHRNRSRSVDRKSSKKHRRRSYSQSPSPNRHTKHSRDKSRYRSRSRSPHSGSYDKYYSSSDKKSRSKHRDYEDGRIRTRH